MNETKNPILTADGCGENCLTCGRCLTDDAETPRREE